MLSIIDRSRNEQVFKNGVNKTKNVFFFNNFITSHNILTHHDLKKKKLRQKKMHLA